MQSQVCALLPVFLDPGKRGPGSTLFGLWVWIMGMFQHDQAMNFVARRMGN